MAFNRLCFVVLFLLFASLASSMTLDELLSGYDWNVNNKDLVNSVSYSNIDSDSDSLFDIIQSG